MMHSLVSNLLILTTSLVFFQIQSKADEVVVLQTCFDSANYTSGSQFQTNLYHLFASLYANAPLNGFNATVSGQDPDRVYGLVQCRGDSSAEDCRQCVNTSSIEIVRLCPNRKQGAIRYGHCLLRYSDMLFFDQPEELRTYAYGGKKVSDPVRFDHQLGALMNNLSYNAAYSQSKFATGMISFLDFQHIYGMLQCTRDLSESNCEYCLQVIIEDLPNCCNTKPGGNVFAVSCVLRFEVYPFYKIFPPPPRVEATPPTLPAPVEARTNTARRDGNGNNWRIIVIVVIPLLTALMLALFVSTCLLWRKTSKKYGVGDVEVMSEDSLLMDLSTLKIATGNFSDANKLGEGGFGPVYKGTLLDGCEIAVKRLSTSSMQGLEQLITEVQLVAKLQHRNLVRLLGCCLEEQEKLLVYEYLPNSSLDRFLFDRVKRLRLNWQHRFMIITGIARGLLYLHQDSQITVIHRDLKASNVLLDENMNPKISDFGLARLFAGNQSDDKTSRIAGTYGYMAPEYAILGHFSTKSDVFSFGVLVLEILTGRKNTSSHTSDSSTNLLSYVWKHWTSGTIFELLDPTLGEHCPRSEVSRCFHIGLLCVQDAAVNRPTMSSVVLMLDSYSVTLPTPSEPAFFVRPGWSKSDEIRREANDCDQCTPKLGTGSTNDVTITELDPR